MGTALLSAPPPAGRPILLEQAGRAAEAAGRSSSLPTAHSPVGAETSRSGTPFSPDWPGPDRLSSGGPGQARVEPARDALHLFPPLRLN